MVTSDNARFAVLIGFFSNCMSIHAAINHVLFLFIELKSGLKKLSVSLFCVGRCVGVFALIAPVSRGVLRMLREFVSLSCYFLLKPVFLFAFLQKYCGYLLIYIFKNTYRSLSSLLMLSLRGIIKFTELKPMKVYYALLHLLSGVSVFVKSKGLMFACICATSVWNVSVFIKLSLGVFEKSIFQLLTMINFCKYA